MIFISFIIYQNAEMRLANILNKSKQRVFFRKNSHGKLIGCYR